MLQRKSLSQMKKGERVKGRSLIPSKKCEVDGIKFDSEAEKAYYVEVMKPMADKGHEVYYHPIIEIFPGIKWELDFMYVNRLNQWVFVDIKGMKVSREAAIKIKMWKSCGPYTLEIIKRDTHSGMFLSPETIPKGKYKISNFDSILHSVGKKI